MTTTNDIEIRVIAFQGAIEIMKRGGSVFGWDQYRLARVARQNFCYIAFGIDPSQENHFDRARESKAQDSDQASDPNTGGMTLGKTTSLAATVGADAVQGAASPTVQETQAPTPVETVAAAKPARIPKPKKAKKAKAKREKKPDLRVVEAATEAPAAANGAGEDHPQAAA